MGNTLTKRKNPYNTANDPCLNNRPPVLFLASSTKPPAFQQLPYDIELYITSLLNLPDILLLSSCSRQKFRRTKWTLPSHCNDLRIPPHIRPFFPRWCKRVVNGQRVLSTSFSGKKREGWQKPTSVLHSYNYSSRHGQPEGDGTSQEVKGAWVIALLKVCPRLRNLTLYHSTHSFDSETLCQIISVANENFDVISLLRHSGSQVDDRVIDAFIKHLAKFPKAEERSHRTRFNLDRMNRLSNDSVCKLIRSTSSSLTHLNLYACLSLTNDVMSSIGKYCPSLIHLSLGSCSMTGRTIERYTYSPKKVINVHAYNFSNTGMTQKPIEPLVTLIQGCTQLKRLSLYNNQAVTDEWLDVISTANGASKLAILNLSLCNGITGHGVTRLIDALGPSLRTLDLLKMEGSTQESIFTSFNPSGHWIGLDLLKMEGSTSFNPVHREADGKIPSLRIRHGDYEKCQTASFRPDSLRGHQCMYAIGDTLRIRKADRIENEEDAITFASYQTLIDSELERDYYLSDRDEENCWRDPTYHKDLPTLYAKEKTIDESFVDENGIVVRNMSANRYHDKYLLERKVCNVKTNKIRVLCYWVPYIHLAHIGEEFKDIIIEVKNNTFLNGKIKNKDGCVVIATDRGWPDQSTSHSDKEYDVYSRSEYFNNDDDDDDKCRNCNHELEEHGNPDTYGARECPFGLGHQYGQIRVLKKVNNDGEKKDDSMKDPESVFNRRLGTRHEIADWFDPQEKLEEEETEAAMLATAIAASMTLDVMHRDVVAPQDDQSSSERKDGDDPNKNGDE